MFSIEISIYRDNFKTYWNISRCFLEDRFLLAFSRMRECSGMRISFLLLALTNWKRRADRKRFIRRNIKAKKNKQQKGERLSGRKSEARLDSRTLVVGLIVIDPLGSLTSLLTWSRRSHHLPTIQAAPSYAMT